MRHSFLHRAHDLAHALHFGRHHRGFQGFGHGPGQMFRDGDGRGAGGLGAGRKLGSADLQLLLLSLLAEKPAHGYELIKALDERSNGYYSPSPGMVYPALTWLDEIGHARVELDGTKKRYHVTADGTAFLEANRAAVDTLLEQLAWIGQRMDAMRSAFADPQRDDASEDFDAPPADAADPGRRRGRGSRARVPDGDFATEVRQARRNLKAALIGKLGASTDEQRRIADVLERAAREIRGDN